MHVVTFTRSTPDTAAKVWVDSEGKVTWGDVATVVNPWDEYSLEETIVQAKNGGGDSTVIAIGSELHNDALKHSMAMSVKNALRVEEAGADISDSLVWSALAAGAIRKIGAVDLVIFGKESVDVATDQHTYQLARRLGWTMLSYVSAILEADYEAGAIRVEKMHGTRQAGGLGQVAGCHLRDEGHKRAALSQLPRHSQGGQGDYSGVERGRPEHRTAAGGYRRFGFYESSRA